MEAEFQSDPFADFWGGEGDWDDGMEEGQDNESEE